MSVNYKNNTLSLLEHCGVFLPKLIPWPNLTYWYWWFYDCTRVQNFMTRWKHQLSVQGETMLCCVWKMRQLELGRISIWSAPISPHPWLDYPFLAYRLQPRGIWPCWNICQLTPGWTRPFSISRRMIPPDSKPKIMISPIILYPSLFGI